MSKKTHRNPSLQNKRQSLKSSLEARRLIRASIRRYGSEHKAARALGLPNQAQLHKILHGQMRDTPSMRLAIARADKRAARAWSLEREEQTNFIDRELACKLIHNLEIDLELLKVLCK